MSSEKKSSIKILFFIGHLTFLRGKILHFLEQDSYRNEGLSIYEISRNGTTTKLNNKVNQHTLHVGLNKVQEYNQKESRLRDCSMQLRCEIFWFFFSPFVPSKQEKHVHAYLVCLN